VKKMGLEGAVNQDQIETLGSFGTFLLAEERRTVSGQEAVLTMQIINGEVFEYEYTGNLMDGEYRLYAAPIPATVSGQEAERDVRDFQRELANYFEDIGDPSGATMIRNFSDLSGYAGASAAKQQSTPAYSAPFTTDVPHCCGDPDACNDPCIEVSDAAMERSVSAAERLMEKLGETTFVRKKEPK
jgi:hypothetical protein